MHATRLEETHKSALCEARSEDHLIRRALAFCCNIGGMTTPDACPYQLISKSPCDIFFVNCRPEDTDKLATNHFSEAIVRGYSDCGFRGISMESLPAVLERGIDVHPTDEVIFVDDLDKALEYGTWPKILLALRWSSLKSTFKELPPDATEAQIEIARSEFPTTITQEDGSTWCTRLKEDDRRIASGYEIAYSKWIPGDPWAAIRAVFVLGAPHDVASLERLLSSQSLEGEYRLSDEERD